jgi:hypothetical protein
MEIKMAGQLYVKLTNNRSHQFRVIRSRAFNAYGRSDFNSSSAGLLTHLKTMFHVKLGPCTYKVRTCVETACAGRCGQTKPAMGCCKHGDQPNGSKKPEKLLHYVSDYELLKKNCTSWSEFTQICGIYMHTNDTFDTKFHKPSSSDSSSVAIK